MDEIRQKIRVAFDFPVHFTTGVFAAHNPLLASLITSDPGRGPADVLAVIDDGVARAHAGITDAVARYQAAHAHVFRLAGSVLVIPGGEACKTGTDTLDVVGRAIHQAALCRHSYVVAVGGGAMLDVVGYAAAIAHRGVRLIRVPTTVLAQDDSAVGVKNGINAFGVKNYLGTFAPPYAVINDAAFLTTLLDRDWLGGVSEAVKAALIRDAPFFDELERLAPAIVARDAAAMDVVVRRSAALHLAHIAQGGDPFETGSSRPLDFGHWAAHKLEQLTSHRLRHGEAVAIGIALDTTYACLVGLLSERDWHRITDLLIALRLAVYVPELGAHLDLPEHERSVLRGLEEFREHLGGQLTILLLRSIGQPVEVHEIDRSVMIRAIDVLRRIEDARLTGAAMAPVLAAALSGGAR